MRYIFKNTVRYFECCGVPMVGDIDNNIVIGLDEIGKATVQSILNGKETDVNVQGQEELLSVLNESGFFVASESGKKNVVTAYFHVTSNCNLHCVGCYSNEEQRNSKMNLSIEQCQIICNNLKRAGVECLIISGGEPLMRTDLPEILRYAKQVCQIPRVQVVSNGMMARAKYDAILPYIDQISISVDGYNENISYLRDSDMTYVLDTVKYLSQITDKLCMIFTLHSKNINHIQDYITLSTTMQVPFTFSLLTVENSEEFSNFQLKAENFDRLKTLEEEFGLPIEEVVSSGCIGCKSSCGLGNRIVSIASNGDVYPCHMLQNYELKLGNALTEEISSIVGYSGEVMAKWNVEAIKECSKCEYNYLCGGGCYARRYLSGKSIETSCDLCCAIYKTDIKRTICSLINGE